MQENQYALFFFLCFQTKTYTFSSGLAMTGQIHWIVSGRRLHSVFRAPLWRPTVLYNGVSLNRSLTFTHKWGLLPCKEREQAAHFPPHTSGHQLTHRWWLPHWLSCEAHPQQFHHAHQSQPATTCVLTRALYQWSEVPILSLEYFLPNHWLRWPVVWCISSLR